MKLENPTWNQHYVSQAEQRRNAIPGTGNIFEFGVASRQPAVLTDPRRVSIRRNLAFGDLFTFAHEGGGPLRKNLETVFGRYESKLWGHAARVLAAVEANEAPPAESVCGLFVAKYMNFLRNPYCVTKALATIGPAIAYEPVDPGLAATYEQVKTGNRRRREAVCERFGLAEAEYDRWLAALFMSLVKIPRANASLLEQTVNKVFSTAFVIMKVCVYDGSEAHACLLSDRGFNEPRRDRGVLSLEFNLAATAFVRFLVFSAQAFESELRGEAGLSQREWERARSMGLVTPGIRVLYSVNDLEALSAYNQLTVLQCAERVFGAHAEPWF